MLSQSEGEGAYRLDPALGKDSGAVETPMTGVYPYVRIALNARVSALRDPLIFCFRIDAQLIEHTYRSQFLTMLASVDVGV